MGAVYRATDTNLGRDVAIKVLPPEVAEDPERLNRFKREAHLLAALNHPHIAAIYGLEEDAGHPFLALELVEGEDISERIARAAIPVDEALEIAEQIAEALEEAHNKGIVHRDLKPANVKLTPDGNVKVLDFGLAKAWGGSTGTSSSPDAMLSQSPTIANAGTIAGVILGTAAYMSPEQARGRSVDKRSDVWSFGVLLWEMLTGRALFAGATVTDVIAAVVTREPDLSALPESTPPAVRRLLERCLRKDPRTRLPDMGAARLELQEVLAGTSSGGSRSERDAAATAQWLNRARERAIWATGALLLAGLSAFLMLRHPPEFSAMRPLAHLILDTPDDQPIGDFNPPAVSPDGRYIAFAGHPLNGPSRLWFRALDSPEARPVPGTEGANAPFWSADSEAIAFVAGRSEIRKIILTGGTVQRICVLPQTGMTGATWNHDGTIVFSTGAEKGLLYSVSAAGGTPKPLTIHDGSRGETGHWWPHFLPDGRHILFDIASQKPENSGLYVTSLDAPGERHRILPDTARSVYASPGYLLFVHDSVLLAQPFDARRLVVTGDSLLVTQTVAAWASDLGWGWFSASDTGIVTWISGSRSDVRLEWIDRNGRRLGQLGEPGNYGQIALSPDNRRVALEVVDADKQSDIWLIDVARGVSSRVTADPANERDPVWSPDSQELVFSSDAGGDQNLLVKDLQADSPPSPLPGGIGHTPGERDIAESWSRLGNLLIFTTIGTDRTVWTASLDARGPAEPLMKSRFQLDEPQISPDARWMAYISNESGRQEVYIEPFRRRGSRILVSTNGGGQPKWRGDGRELFYLSPDGGLMAVDIKERAAGLEVGIPAMLVPARDLRAVIEGPDYDDYAVTSDGQRFLVKTAVASDDRPRIHVLLNWPSLLKR